MKAVFTTFEAAKLCHVSPLSIINWVNAGRLAAFRTPGGHRRIRREDLLGFMRDNGLPVPEELGFGLGRRRVMIVDADPRVRDPLAEHLRTRTRPYDVQVAGDAFEAGCLLASYRPELAVIDARLPGLDGFLVCRAIKSRPEGAAIPVLLLVASPAAPDTEARVSACGALRWFGRPVDPRALGEAVDSLLDRQPGSRPRRGRARA